MSVDIAQLRALEAAATAGPWEWFDEEFFYQGPEKRLCSLAELDDADAALVVFLRNNAIAMADRIETLEARLALAEELLGRYTRCPVHGHWHEAWGQRPERFADLRTISVGCHDDQCQNPDHVKYARCTHSSHDVTEFLASRPEASS